MDRTRPLLVHLCEKFERESGRKNRVTQAVLEAWNDGEIDLSKLMLANGQASALLAGGYHPTDPVFDQQIQDERYLKEMREAFKKSDDLREAGPWTSNLEPFRLYTGPIPPPYHKLIPPDAYEGALWKKIVITTNLENFKIQTRSRLEDLARYARVPEGGEYNTSPREGYQLYYRPAKYGLEVALTWEMVVNDDMKAFSDLMRQLVMSGVDTLNAYVWGAIMANPLIWDGLNVFHIAHNNLMLLALSIPAIGTGRAMMNRHLSVAGKPIIGLSPHYLIIPPELEQTADIILQSSGMPVAQMSSATYNPEAGKLEKLMTRYLVSTTDWYLWATPSASPVLELGFLFGRDTPEIDQNNVWQSEEIHYRGKYVAGGEFVGYKGAILSTTQIATSV